MNPQDPNLITPNQNPNIDPNSEFGAPVMNSAIPNNNPTLNQQPLNSPSLPASTPPNNPNNKKITYIIVASVIALLLLGGVLFALSSAPEKNKDNKKTESSINTIKPKIDDTKTNELEGLVCKEFVASDFDVIVNGAPDKTDGFFITYKTKSGKYNLFFKYLFVKNSNQYDSQAIVDRSIQSVVRFSDQNKEKKWNIALNGSFAVDTEANIKLANERTQKVKADLVKAGVPENRFIIKDAAKATSSSLNYVDIDDRYVQAIIGANCK